jgi:aspartyl-tRNA(Asn)/glutamyl-tRNA(Gln) amidotransferase subunit C
VEGSLKGGQEQHVAIDEALIEKLAQLSSIELPAEDLCSLKADLQEIVEYFKQLGELSFENSGGRGPDPERSGSLRSDTTAPGLLHPAVFLNAPETKGRFLKAPPVIKR